MKKEERTELICGLSGLCVFRKLREQEPVRRLLELLSSEGGPGERMDSFGAFVWSLARDGYCFSDFLRRAVFEDENPYMTGMARGKGLPEALKENAAAELRLFSRLSELSPAELWERDGESGFSGHIPCFENHPVDFQEAYEKRLSEICCYGYGIFSSAGMFRVEGEEILPVEAADSIDLDSFVGYEAERQKVFDNTRALVEGKPAANVLLYGDAGTGKSSTVKACANYFYRQGVRLIELRKDQLLSLSAVMGKIADNPLKFIIFIDDLSFNKNDDSFSMLKAALEGSASARAKNAVIYATSNRRHIVKESFSDRESGDEVHLSDTMQELLSLSDRFGLKVYFGKPDKNLYLEIVEELAKREGISMEREELFRRAEAFALGCGSRSPRAAGQFIDSLMIQGAV